MKVSPRLVSHQAAKIIILGWKHFLNSLIRIVCDAPDDKSLKCLPWVPFKLVQPRLSFFYVIFIFQFQDGVKNAFGAAWGFCWNMLGLERLTDERFQQVRGWSAAHVSVIPFLTGYSSAKRKQTKEKKYTKAFRAWSGQCNANVLYSRSLITECFHWLDFTPHKQLQVISVICK